MPREATAMSTSSRFPSYDSDSQVAVGNTEARIPALIVGHRALPASEGQCDSCLSSERRTIREPNVDEILEDM